MCLINTHILIYRYVRCDCKLRNAFRFYFVLCVFTYIIDVWSIVSKPNFHRLCIWLMYTFWCVNMPSVTAGYRRFSYSIAFFPGNFHILQHVWNVITSSNFHKSCVFLFFNLRQIARLWWYLVCFDIMYQL